jgi:hypothetical protein
MQDPVDGDSLGRRGDGSVMLPRAGEDLTQPDQRTGQPGTEESRVPLFQLTMDLERLGGGRLRLTVATGLGQVLGKPVECQRKSWRGSPRRRDAARGTGIWLQNSTRARMPSMSEKFAPKELTDPV